jgi:RNA polymerase sigma-70 factor (ECF subfamily)
MVAGMTSETQAGKFNEYRPLLFGIAWRMLGNPADAEDVLQEAFLRWMKADMAAVRSPRPFLVTVVTRLCLNHLDLARVKKEISFEPDALREWFVAADAIPASDAGLADALDAAFSVVLKCLSPVERAVFLLREVFECEYSEVSRIVEKSEENCRQIVRRARERIAGRDPRFEVSVEEQEALLREFLSATGTGDMDRLAKALAQDASLHCDGENLGATAPAPIHGASAVSEFLTQRVRKLQPASVQFRIGKAIDFEKDSKSRSEELPARRQVPLVLAYCEGRLDHALALVTRAGRIGTIYVVSCPVRLRSLAAQYPAGESGKNLA